MEVYEQQQLVRPRSKSDTQLCQGATGVVKFVTGVVKSATGVVKSVTGRAIIGDEVIQQAPRAVLRYLSPHHLS